MHITKEKLYQYLFYFLVLSFLGWVFETISVWIFTGNFTDRGYFFVRPILWGMPIIEMYGIGGLLILVFFENKSHNNIRIFVYGLIMMTLFELVASYWCQYIIHQTFWSYNNEFLNFQGRICLKSSLAWGFLSLIAVRCFEPFLFKLNKKCNEKKFYYIIITILIAYVVICGMTKYVFYPEVNNH